MDLVFLKDFSIPLIVGICMCLGYILKKWVKDVDNKLIPTALAVVGLIVNLWMNNFTITPEIVLGGLVSGLASTGLYETFRNLIEKKTKE